VKANPYLLGALMTAANALTSLGFSLAALSSAGEAQVNAGYAVSRSLALAVAALGLVRFRSRPTLLALALILSLMQLSDAVIGLLIHDPVKTLGPLLLAMLTLWAAWRLYRAAANTESPG